MSIGQGVTVITGLPGSGKTAMMVDIMSKIRDRPLFVMGIPDLKIEHNVCPPVSEWVEQRADPDDPTLKMPYFTFQPNSVVVLDEAQRVYRPRPVGSKVPDIVAAFETRRHTGCDFVLLTQDVTFLDSNVRKLVARHIHIHQTMLGAYRLEWKGLGDPTSSVSRDLATRSRYSPPKSAFSLYKSSELHTKSVVKRPFLLYAFIPLLVALVAGGFYMKHRVFDPKVAPVVSAAPGAVSAGSAVQTSRPKTAQEYIAEYQPRVAGLPHSAPAYDEVTKPVLAPEPIGCMSSVRTGCKCYTQQGTPYETSQEICKQVMVSGLWMPWKSPQKNEQAQPIARQEAGKPAVVASSGQSPYTYGSNVGDAPGGSHNFAGGLSEPPKKTDSTFTIKPAG